MADVPLFVVSDYASSERRITPSWSIAQLKGKLESVTGIPPSCQQIFLKTSADNKIPITAPDEEAVRLQEFPLAPYAELQVSETAGQPAMISAQSTRGADAPHCNSCPRMGFAAQASGEQSPRQVAHAQLFVV